MKKIFSILTLLVLSFSVYAQEVIEEVSILENWHHQHFSTDSVYGVGTEVAIDLLKSLKKEPEPIVVAILDSGVDIDHEDLKANIWVNPKEIPNNQKDDDDNGYVDDINGWNFIGGKDGKNVNDDTLEVTRLYSKYKAIFESENKAANEKNKKRMADEYADYLIIKNEWEEEYSKAKVAYNTVKPSIDKTKELFKIDPLDGKKITSENLEEFDPATDDEIKLKEVLIKMISDYGENALSSLSVFDLKKEMLSGMKHSITKYEYYYNPVFNPRPIVGDKYKNKRERYYGNNDVEGPDALHGTHVAGIVSAVRSNNIGGGGIGGNHVKIMSVRTVPNGDERDKDVANAIRYAVENGAKIINMSFGKGYSPEKEIVWEAMKYAERKNVLLIHAAGNSNENIDEKPNFPTNFNNGSEVVKNWIEVGASTRYNDALRASFSNYGRTHVNIFAPGLEIYSTTPENKYQLLQGTSMAAPVVAGCAALIWSHFPNLNAIQIKEVLEKSVNKPNDVESGNLSTSGGIVDLSKAIELALKMDKTNGKGYSIFK